MKITEVKTYHLRYPLKEKFATSGSWSTSRGAQVVEIVTDSGLVGWWGCVGCGGWRRVAGVVVGGGA